MGSHLSTKSDTKYYETMRWNLGTACSTNNKDTRPNVGAVSCNNLRTSLEDEHLLAEIPGHPGHFLTLVIDGHGSNFVPAFIRDNYLHVYMQTPAFIKAVAEAEAGLSMEPETKAVPKPVSLNPGHLSQAHRDTCIILDLMLIIQMKNNGVDIKDFFGGGVKYPKPLDPPTKPQPPVKMGIIKPDKIKLAWEKTWNEAYEAYLYTNHLLDIETRTPPENITIDAPKLSPRDIRALRRDFVRLKAATQSLEWFCHYHAIRQRRCMFNRGVQLENADEIFTNVLRNLRKTVDEYRRTVNGACSMHTPVSEAHKLRIFELWSVRMKKQTILPYKGKGGAVLAGAVITPTHHIVFNVGDCRMQRVINNKLQHLTADHNKKLDGELKRIALAGLSISRDKGGRITAPNTTAGISPSRALGDHMFKRSVLTPEIYKNTRVRNNDLNTAYVNKYLNNELIYMIEDDDPWLSNYKTLQEPLTVENEWPLHGVTCTVHPFDAGVSCEPTTHIVERPGASYNVSNNMIDEWLSTGMCDKYTRTRVSDEEQMLLGFCDGITGAIPSKNLASLLFSYIDNPDVTTMPPAGEVTPVDVLKQLINEAIHMGTRDNCTGLMVAFQELNPQIRLPSSANMIKNWNVDEVANYLKRVTNTRSVESFGHKTVEKPCSYEITGSDLINCSKYTDFTAIFKPPSLPINYNSMTNIQLIECINKLRVEIGLFHTHMNVVSINDAKKEMLTSQPPHDVDPDTCQKNTLIKWLQSHHKLLVALYKRLTTIGGLHKIHEQITILLKGSAGLTNEQLVFWLKTLVDCNQKSVSRDWVGVFKDMDITGSCLDDINSEEDFVTFINSGVRKQVTEATIPLGHGIIYQALMELRENGCPILYETRPPTVIEPAATKINRFIKSKRC